MNSWELKCTGAQVHDFKGLKDFSKTSQFFSSVVQFFKIQKKNFLKISSLGRTTYNLSGWPSATNALSSNPRSGAHGNRMDQSCGYQGLYR